MDRAHQALEEQTASVLKWVKETGQKKREARERVTWVQLERQPAPPREVHCVRTDGKEPELPEPIPYGHGLTYR